MKNPRMDNQGSMNEKVIAVAKFVGWNTAGDGIQPPKHGWFILTNENHADIIIQLLMLAVLYMKNWYFQQWGKDGYFGICEHGVEGFMRNDDGYICVTWADLPLAVISACYERIKEMFA